jgi:hypothetical protein
MLGLREDDARGINQKQLLHDITVGQTALVRGSNQKRVPQDITVCTTALEL